MRDAFLSTVTAVLIVCAVFAAGYWVGGLKHKNEVADKQYFSELVLEHPESDFQIKMKVDKGGANIDIVNKITGSSVSLSDCLENGPVVTVQGVHPYYGKAFDAVPEPKDEPKVVISAKEQPKIHVFHPDHHYDVVEELHKRGRILGDAPADIKVIK